MVHKFMAFFLKNKMDAELERFAVVESAFKRIKSSTVIIFFAITNRVSMIQRKSSRNILPESPSIVSYYSRSPATKKSWKTSKPPMSCSMKKKTTCVGNCYDSKNPPSVKTAKTRSSR